MSVDIDLSQPAAPVVTARSGQTHRSSRRRSTAGRSSLQAIILGAVISGSTGLAVAASHSQHAGTGPVSRAASTGSHTVQQGVAQVTVPRVWRIQAQDPCPLVGPGGLKSSMLLVGVEPSQTRSCGSLPRLAAGQSLTWLFSSRAKATGKPVAAFNGFKAYAASEASVKGYLVPRLGVEILWLGARPGTVLTSLSWSPLHWVLVDGPITPTPKSWVHQYWNGVGVAAPASWPVKEPLILTCSGPFDNGAVVGLGVKVNPVPCAYQPPPTKPSMGVVVTKSSQLSSCPIKSTMTVAHEPAEVCSDPSVQPQEIQVRLLIGGRPMYVTVGLGNAVVARTVIGSLAEVLPPSS